MPEPVLELDAVVVFPVLVEWVPVVLVLEPVLPPLLPPELHAPKLIPAAQPKNTPAVSHTFFMEQTLRIFGRGTIGDFVWLVAGDLRLDAPSSDVRNFAYARASSACRKEPGALPVVAASRLL
jgi:hypothetical protein